MAVMVIPKGIATVNRAGQDGMKRIRTDPTVAPVETAFSMEMAGTGAMARMSLDSASVMAVMVAMEGRVPSAVPIPGRSVGTAGTAEMEWGDTFTQARAETVVPAPRSADVVEMAEMGTAHVTG